MSGTKVERIEGSGENAVIEIEVTTNRPDCLSVLGLAREIAAVTGKKVSPPKISNLAKAARSLEKPKIQILDRKGCPHYTARLIRDITVRPSPEEVQKLLGLVGTRPISNAVDATNFVLFETGQPLHAFDYDKLRGGVVMIRRARKGEKFLGIDGAEYELDDKTLVIADAQGPIAIAGVIGGKSTEVDAGTKNVLLESAYFDPAVVRRAARRYKISTESSYRFERSTDPKGASLASARARDLIIEWAGGEDVSELVERGAPIKILSKAVPLRSSRMNQFLGMKIPQKRSRAILESLGFAVRPSGSDRLLVVVPSFRRDVREEADLVEEVLRIEGFERAPSVLPVTRHADDSVTDVRAVFVAELKKFAAGVGFNEIVTYSLLSAKSLADTRIEEKEAQRIMNPVSVEQGFVRPSLLPGMLAAVLFNVHRKALSLKLFEIGNCFVDEHEETLLSLCLQGGFEENWARKSPASFYDLKGAVENILRFSKINEWKWRPVERCGWCDGQGAELLVGSEVAGCLGNVSPEVLRRWDISHEVFYFELVLDDHFLNQREQGRSIRIKAISKFPSARRDIAFVIEEDVPVSLLEESMKKAAAPFLREVRLFDRYAGKNIPAGKRSLAFSLEYQKETGTFTDQEIQELQERMGDALKREHQVEFR